MQVSVKQHNGTCECVDSICGGTSLFNLTLQVTVHKLQNTCVYFMMLESMISCSLVAGQAAESSVYLLNNHQSNTTHRSLFERCLSNTVLRKISDMWFWQWCYSTVNFSGILHCINWYMVMFYRTVMPPSSWTAQS